MITRLSHAAVSGLLATLLAGCAVAPKYERPAVEVPGAFKEARLSADEQQRWKAAQPADDLARGRWWAISRTRHWMPCRNTPCRRTRTCKPPPRA